MVESLNNASDGLFTFSHCKESYSVSNITNEIQDLESAFVNVNKHLMLRVLNINALATECFV